MNSHDLMYDPYDDPNSKYHLIQCQYLDWDNARAINNLPLFLKGRALTVHNENLQNKATLEACFNTLEARFRTPTHLPIQRYEARTLKQEETILSFATEIHSLLTAAMPNLTEDQRLPLLKAKLNSNLPEHLYAILHFVNIKN
jgi:hypothetical protein